MKKPTPETNVAVTTESTNGLWCNHKQEAVTSGEKVLGGCNRLSRLQVWMLKSALANHIRLNRSFDEECGSDLFFAEIKVGYFDLPACGDPRELYALDKSRMPKKYNAANAAVSRAAWRLEARGLVRVSRFRTLNRRGIELTEEGFRIAQQLAGGAQ